MRNGRSAVLSDDKIVEQLKRDGIDIARRTVAKYREALRIPSSVQRRREKQMAARLGAERCIRAAVALPADARICRQLQHGRRVRLPHQTAARQCDSV